MSLVVSIGATVIGAIALLHARKDGGNNYQVFKAEVLLPLVFSEGMPDREVVEKLEKEALFKLERKTC
ncbi:hypothetical protein GCM10009347_14180 [Shewanella algicola]|uniref:Uncharacterized protein n=1 Tax=Shewanella algicola TaxID=640633 RepID=A0A9X2CDC0_9GAMM|nr:hypothetical protein [Shewanella algicola]MCL1105042.1 hypothetical protein [Shewanella algicola]GGP48130.1 hypothetical protein GCM10009347_14180 [Shewanella algicola]